MWNFIKVGKRFVSTKEYLKLKKEEAEKSQTEETTPKKVEETTPKKVEETVEDMETLIAEYKKLFGKNPHHMIKAEKLKKLIDEKKAK